MMFQDRRDAGRRLARDLRRLSAGDRDVVVLGLARGGVPVAYEVARELRAPLDVFVVRKLGVPGQEELAFGAIASGGVRVLNESLCARISLPPSAIERIAERETRELARREAVFRRGRPPLSVADRTVVLVDDGLATGASMRAALRALRQRGAARVIVGVPVGSPGTCERMAKEADALVCTEQPELFFGVGAFYADFSQTSDAEVCALLAAADAAFEEAAAEPGARRSRRDTSWTGDDCGAQDDHEPEPKT